MANLKNITELPVAESADDLNVIVNDNGFAKQIAASKVGVTSWNNLNDKPFYTSEKTLLEQRVLDGFIEKVGVYGFGTTEIRIDFPSSGIVNVYWDGEIYNCEVRCIFENNEEIEIEVGNAYVFDNLLNNTGEPFFISYSGMKDMSDSNFFITTNSPGSSHTIGIVGEDVHTIDKKFIPDSVKSGVFIMDMTVLTPDNFIDTSYGNTVKEALLNGKTVLQYDGTYYFQIVAFRINETTTGEVYLDLVTSAYTNTTGGVNLAVNRISLLITL